jgi:hypothetical protein
LEEKNPTNQIKQQNKLDRFEACVNKQRERIVAVVGSDTHIEKNILFSPCSDGSVAARVINIFS